MSTQLKRSAEIIPLWESLPRNTETQKHSALETIPTVCLSIYLLIIFMCYHTRNHAAQAWFRTLCFSVSTFQRSDLQRIVIPRYVSTTFLGRRRPTSATCCLRPVEAS